MKWSHQEPVQVKHMYQLPGHRTAESVIVYIPREGAPVRIDLEMISGKNANAWWYNPRNGEPSFIGKFPSKGSRNFQKPDNQDWVLVIDNASGGFKAPGK